MPFRKDSINELSKSLNIPFNDYRTLASRIQNSTITKRIGHTTLKGLADGSISATIRHLDILYDYTRKMGIQVEFYQPSISHSEMTRDKRKNEVALEPKYSHTPYQNHITDPPFP